MFYLINPFCGVLYFMDYPLMILGEIRFFEPVIGGVYYNAWLGQVDIFIGESNSPYSWNNPKYYKVTFFDVVEFRAFSNLYRVSQDEVDIFSDRDVTDLEMKIDPENNMAKILINTCFRDPDLCGKTWVVPHSLDRIFLFSINCGGYVEFLYSGLKSVYELPPGEIEKEWEAQQNRYSIQKNL
jgi:hypothetical protein